MKKIIPLLLLFACSSKQNENSTPSLKVDDIQEKKEVVVYEGMLRLKDEVVPVELSLEQGESGMEAGFTLSAGNHDWTNKRIDRGRYTILYGGPTDENKFELHGQMLSFLLTKDSPRAKPEMNDIDLYFISDGDQKLVLTNDNYERIADDQHFTLYRRSRLLTVEGYLTCEKNRTELFEQNTSERWHVATLGVWSQAKRKYDSLATEEFEGLYLKAVAYWIASDSTDEDLLVIKNILQINKSKAYDDNSLIH